VSEISRLGLEMGVFSEGFHHESQKVEKLNRENNSANHRRD
jgi:hypothetical protein